MQEVVIRGIVDGGMESVRGEDWGTILSGLGDGVGGMVEEVVV